MNLATSAEALFTSSLQPSEHPNASQITTAIRTSLRRLGGTCGCAEACAAEFGEHPDSAQRRMRWALAAAGSADVRRSL